MSKLPFYLYPASWGLKGDAYREAEAYHLYTGEELERQLLKIRDGDNPKVYNRKLIELEHRFGHIDAFTRDRRLIDLDHEGDDLLIAVIALDMKHGVIDHYNGDIAIAKVKHSSGQARDLALLDIELSHGKVSKTEHEKRRATLLDQPWVGIIDSGFNPQEGIDGVFFELDWNAKWIEFLKQHGYSGNSDEQIVDEWFADVCRSHARAELIPSLLVN